ncbi:MAG TPA: TonB-dependent receptor [Steroidobacteraceae bacterium]|jgi:outer membrane receptor protein involved in Fe transport
MRASITSLGLLVLVAPGLAAAAETTPVHAPGEQTADEREFSIAAQPVSQALREYAQQSGDQVVFYSEVGKGLESASVQGRFTREDALQKLLLNTGLKSERVNSKTVAISAAAPLKRAFQEHPVDPPPAVRLAESSERPAPAAVPRAQRAARVEQDEQALFGAEEIIVTGTAVPRRTKFDSSVAVSTFSARDIAQQAPASSADLIAAVPGFWVESTAGTTQGNVFARGIIQDGGYRFVGLMEDGIPIYPVSELSFYNPDQFVRVDATLDRVEALRGGTAPIFTSGAVGGTINFVTRSPLAAPQALVAASISDYNLYRTDVAWNGPLNDDWGMAIGGYYRRSDGIRNPGYTADDGGQFRVQLARTFEQATVEVFAKYIDDRSLFVVPIPLTGNPSDPRGLNGADPGTYALQSEDLARAGLPPSAAEVGLQSSDLRDGIHPQLGTFGVKVDWDFTEQVSLANVMRYTNGEVHFDGIFAGADPVTGTEFAAAAGVAPSYTVLATGAPYAATDLVQNHGHWAVRKDYESLQDDLRLNFLLGPHQLTAGLYFADYSMADRWSLGNLLLMDVSDRPRRLALPGVTDPQGFTQYSFFNLIADYDATQYAVYGADEWQITDRLRIDLGMRYDHESIDGSISNGTTVDLDGDPATPWDNATSLAGTDRRTVDAGFRNFGWSLGLNYEIRDGQAIFGHYTDSARLPHFDNVRDGVLRKDPVTNIELGYKISQRRFVVFATLFHTEFDNVSFNDIDASGTPLVRTTGTRTRGIELEGELLPVDALTLRFSMTLQDPRYRDFVFRDAAGTVFDNTGNTIRRIPKRMWRVTPTYTFLKDRGRVFLTWTHVSDRYSNDENTRTLPRYDKLDAGVAFEVGNRWTLQLTGDNLTDEVGLTEGNPRTDVGAGASGAIYVARPLFGRSFMGSVTYSY